CPSGRYLVLNESLLPADASSSDEAVVVGGTAISIGDACRAVPVKLWLSKSGTKVRARWKDCASLQGKLRLRATIDPTCSVMAGTLIARKLRFTKHFAARLSICGDGILDIARGEQCDGSIGCGPGEVCTGCVCVANQNTTTTTSYIPYSNYHTHQHHDHPEYYHHDTRHRPHNHYDDSGPDDDHDHIEQQHHAAAHHLYHHQHHHDLSATHDNDDEHQYDLHDHDGGPH